MIEKAPNVEYNQSIVLHKMVEDVADDNIIHKIDSVYLYWDKIFKPRNLNSGSIMESCKIQKVLNTKKLYLSGKFLFKTEIHFEFNINKFLAQKLHYLDTNFGAGLQKEKLLSDLDKQSYLNNALMEESIFSSMIEGATITRIKVKDMLRKNKKPKNKSEQMVLNNYKTIQYISEHKDDNISIEKLHDIHRLVTEKHFGR